VHTQRIAKFMMAGGAGALTLAITVLLLFVLPATNPGSISSQAQPEPSEEMGEPAPMPEGEEMGGEMMGEAAPAPSDFTGEPFEAWRPNPFLAGAGVEIESIEGMTTTATRYGPDWYQLPIAARLSMAACQRGPELAAEPAPKPEEEKFMRISSILWTAGKPLAIYETADGKTGSVQPGDIVDNWMVEQIGQDYAMMRNVISGEYRRVPLKSK